MSICLHGEAAPWCQQCRDIAAQQQREVQICAYERKSECPDRLCPFVHKTRTSLFIDVEKIIDDSYETNRYGKYIGD